MRSSKTGEICTFPIHPYVRTILTRWGNDKPKKPINQNMNRYIKEVAELAKIEEEVETRITKGSKVHVETSKKYELVSTHTARRSLATNLVLRDVSPYVIMKITGHSTLSSFDKYVRFKDLTAMMQLKDVPFFQSA